MTSTMTNEELDCYIAKEVFEYALDFRYVSQDPECGGYHEVQCLYENPSQNAQEDFDDGVFFDVEENDSDDFKMQKLLGWHLEQWEVCKSRNPQKWCIKSGNCWEVCPSWSTDAGLIPQLCEKLVELGAGDVIMNYDIDYKSKEYEYDVLINAFSLREGVLLAWNDKSLPRALSLAALAFVRAVNNLQEEKGDGKSA